MTHAAVLDDVLATDLAVLVGVAEPMGATDRPNLFNAIALIGAGQWRIVARKRLLPTYDVFDEDRYFEPANAPTVITHAGRRIGVTICEDIWTSPSLSTRRLYAGPTPLEQLAGQRCDFVVNLSASPWHETKADVRNSLVVTGAGRALAVSGSSRCRARRAAPRSRR